MISLFLRNQDLQYVYVFEHSTRSLNDTRDQSTPVSSLLSILKKCLFTWKLNEELM